MAEIEQKNLARKSARRAAELFNDGDLNSALFAYDEAIKFDPALASAHCNKGVALSRLSRFEEAEEAFRRALAVSPNFASAHFNLGNLLRRQERFEEAANAYQAASRENPDDVAILCNLVLTLNALGRYDEALSAGQKAVALTPTAEVYNNLGNTLSGLGRFKDAGDAYTASAKLSPNHVPAIYNVCRAKIGEGKFAEAVKELKKIVELQPGFLPTYSSLSQSLIRLDRPREAVDILEKGLKYLPDHPDLLTCLGVAHGAMGQNEKAYENFDKAITESAAEGSHPLPPTHAQAHKLKGLSLLAEHRYEEGAKEFEWRWLTGENRLPDGLGPRWIGGPIKGKRLLVLGEDHPGDCLQLLRFLVPLKKLGCDIVLRCPRYLHELLVNFPGVSEVVSSDRPAPSHDFYISQFSLLGFPDLTNNFADFEEAYLRPTPKLMATLGERLPPPNGRRRVALIWARNRPGPNELRDYCPLKLFSPILDNENIQFFSMQGGYHAGDIEKAGFAKKITDFTPFPSRLALSASILGHMDIVISIDGTMAHIAGAMGVPTWLMLPHIPEWRWRSEGDKTPWYANHRLFKQPSFGDWESVVNDVTKKLKETD